MAAAQFTFKSRDGLKWLESPNLSQFPWLVHAFSTRRGGRKGGSGESLNLGTAEPSQSSSVRENRRHFFKALGTENFALASLHQIHSAEVSQVIGTNGDQLRYVPPGSSVDDENASHQFSGDAIITASPGILLSVRTADCLPVLLMDCRLRVVAAIHAGWRGALKRIVEKAVGEMRRVFNSRPRDLFAALGPSIGACCYEVGPEVVDAFHGSFRGADAFFRKVSNDHINTSPSAGLSFLSSLPPGHARSTGSGLALDLIAVAVDQLKSAGVPRTHIASIALCTTCRPDLFFSYRREGNHAGRMMAVIGIRTAGLLPQSTPSSQNKM